MKISYDKNCLTELRDFLLDGTTIDLVEKKVIDKLMITYGLLINLVKM